MTLSDMKNENLSPEQEQEAMAQQTRVMQPVDATVRPPRRRRSERYDQEEPTAQEPLTVPVEDETIRPMEETIRKPDGIEAAESVDAPGAEEAAVPAEPAASRPLPLTRVIPAQDTASRPAVPRPNVLTRAEKMAALEENLGSTTRRPMGTPPGFVPRKPISLESRQTDAEEKPVRGSSMSARMPTLQPSTNPRRPASLDRQETEQGKKKSPVRLILIALVILLLIAGLVIVGMMLLGQRGGEEPVTASGFSVVNDQGTAPLDVAFNLTTDKSVTQVRLVNEAGVPLSAMSVPMQNADSIIWVMTLPVTDGYEGLVLAQIYDGTQWHDTGMSQMLQIAAPVTGQFSTEEPPVMPTASGFTVANDHGVAPLDVAFNLTTNSAVTQVRLVDEAGMALSAMCVPMQNGDTVIWVVTLPVTDGYEGLVLAQIYDGAQWHDTGMSQMLQIAAPAVVDVGAFGEATDVPTEGPAAAITDAPTDIPTPDATEAYTATPTLAVSATPTMAMAGTPTPVPAEMAMTQVPVSYEEPTAAPEAEPTQEMATEVTPEPEATSTAAPTATPPLTGIAAEGADPSLIRDTVIYNGSSKVESYLRERMLNMPIADRYLTQPYGVLTYRGNAFRQNAAVGTVGDISGMTVVWTAEAGSVKGSSSTFYGIGWTGQPAIIKWSKEVRAATNIFEEKRNTTALKEVIIAGMDGKIYFLDLSDGQPTRDAINLGYPMRGTPSLHPLGYPIMTVGQYGRFMAKGTGDIGLRFYNLLTQKQAYWIDGLDGKAKRPYSEIGAFDTSALIDPNSDTLVAIGTNGMLYTVVLNTEYNKTEETVSIKPTVVSMKSRTKGQANRNTAVQSSPAMYGTYVYYADMSGVLRCVDTTTMTTVWAVNTDDAVEAAIALDMDENGDLWLYTCNTLDRRKKGDCSIRRYNALTGEADWVLAVNVAATKNEKTPGAMASPVIGQNELSDLVYFTLSSVSAKGAATITGADGAKAMAGVLLAMDKASGEIVWAHDLDAYSYSSPVAVYNEDGKGWIIQASSSGVITLLDGVTGSVISTLTVEGTIDASPAVYNDTLVIGTTGKGTSFIYGIKLQ